jgi:hypothetical protein
VIFVSGLENGYYLIGIVYRLPDVGLFWVRIIYRDENRLDAGRMAGLHKMSYLFTHCTEIFGFLDPRPDPVRLVGVAATLEKMRRVVGLLQSGASESCFGRFSTSRGIHFGRPVAWDYRQAFGGPP